MQLTPDPNAPDPAGPPVPRAHLLRLLEVWAQEANRLIAAADPGSNRAVGRPPVSESAQINALHRRMESILEGQERAENLARARALLTVRRDILDLLG